MKLMGEKDYERAILEFKNASILMPKAPEPIYQLGLAYVATGKVSYFPFAVAAFKKVVALNPQHQAGQRELARLETLTSQREVLQDAEQRLKELVGESQGDVDSLNVLAVAQLKLGKFSAALEELDAALLRAPENFRSLALLVIVKVLQKDFAGAEAILQKAINDNPASAETRVLLGRVYFLEGKLPEAEVALQDSLRIAPQEITARVMLGEIQMLLKQLPAAEATFKQLSTMGDKDARPAYALFLYDQGRRDEAVRELERLAKQDPGDRTVRSQLVAAYYLIGRVPDAQRILDISLKKNRKDAEALIQRAEILGAQGKYSQAESDLNNAMRLNPLSAELHYIRAKVFEARGQELTYRQELAEALRLRPAALPVRVELSSVLRHAKDSKAALEILNETPASQKHLLEFIIERNWALGQNGDFAEMRKGIDAALALSKSAEALAQDGYWKLNTRNYPAAQASFEAALKVNSGNVEALRGLMRTSDAQNRTKAGLERIKAYAAQQQDSGPVQQFLGEALLASGDAEGARAAWRQAKTVDPRSLQIDLRLVQLDIQEKKLDEAAARLRTVLANDPNNSTAHLWLGNLSATKGDHKAAGEEYRKAAEVDPQNASALNNLAYELSEQGKADEALKYAQKAKELAPENPTYSDTLGWVLYRKGLYDGALVELRRAANRNDSKAEFQYHLAMAYLKLGDRRNAQSNLDAALKRDPSLSEAKAARNEMLHSK